MIAKHIPMKESVKSSVVRLVNYITDPLGKKSRIDGFIVGNCITDDPETAALEMLLVQEQNTRASNDKTYHLLLSFQEGEEPDQHTIFRLTRDVLTKLELDRHQYIVVTHKDTDHTHVHVVVNLIHPDKFTIHTPYKAYEKLSTFQPEWEEKYRLAPDNHQPTGITAGQRAARAMETITGQESLLGYIQRECLSELDKATTWEEFHATLARFNLTASLRGNGLVFTHQGTIAVKGSDVNRGYSKGNLEKRFGPLVLPEQQSVQEPQKTYSKQPLVDKNRLGKRNPLRDEYIFSKAKADRNRAKRLEAIKKDYNDLRDQLLMDLRHKQWEIKHLNIGRVRKKALYETVWNTFQSASNELRQQASSRRRIVYQEERNDTYVSWLQDRAIHGRHDCLAALRSRAYAMAKGIKSTLSGMEKDKSGNMIRIDSLLLDAKIDVITKHGTVIYAVGDDAIRDNGYHIHVSKKASEETDILALRLAKKRYGTTLRITGDDAFRERMVRAATKARLYITFTDDRMERERRTIMRQTHPTEQHWSRNELSWQKRTFRSGMPPINAPGIPFSK